MTELPLDDQQVVRNAARLTAASVRIFYDELRLQDLPEQLCIAIVSQIWAENIGAERASTQLKDAERLFSKMGPLLQGLGGEEEED